MPFNPDLNYNDPNTPSEIMIPPRSGRVISYDYALLRHKGEFVGLVQKFSDGWFARGEIFKNAFSKVAPDVKNPTDVAYEIECFIGSEKLNPNAFVYTDVWITEYGSLMDTGAKFVLDNVSYSYENRELKHIPLKWDEFTNKVIENDTN